MAKIVRKNQKIFGDSAASGDIRQFASLADGSPLTTTDPETIQALTRYDQGWRQALTGNDVPALEDFNALDYLETYQLAYLMQAGIAEWNTDTVYYIGSFCQESGVIYQSITDTNSANLPSTDGGTNWESQLELNNLNINNKLNFTGNAATISSGSIAYVGAKMVIDTEAAAASDTLDTITGGTLGDRVLLVTANSSRNVVYSHITGNIAISTENNITTSNVNDSILLEYNGTFWNEISRSIQNDFLTNSLGQGYTYLSNGLLLQWGTYTTVLGNTLYDVTPNITWSSGLLWANATASSQIGLVAGGSNTAGNIKVWSDTATGIITWFAIGV